MLFKFTFKIVHLTLLKDLVEVKPAISQPGRQL